MEENTGEGVVKGTFRPRERSRGARVRDNLSGGGSNSTLP